MTFHCRDLRLLPCPFCGGEPQLTARATNQGFIAFVSCSICTAQSKVFTLRNSFYGEDDDFSDVGFQNAARAWQMRAQMEPAAKGVNSGAEY